MRARPHPIAVLATLLATLLFWAPAASGAQRMTRTLKQNPAVVIAAFGTSTRAQVTYDVFDRQLREAIPDLEIRWAFTSEVIRQRVNKRWAAEGKSQRLFSLQQVLADLEAEGFTKAAVQPLHIFPGEEYEEVVRIASAFPGLRVELGETLLQRWESVHEVVAVLARDFLPDTEGCTVVVAHGTPSTHLGSNLTYLGLDRYLERNFSNVYLGAVEGIITRDDALGPARRHPGSKVRFVPLMYVAGDHIMNDILGEEETAGELSWKRELEAAGKSTDVLTVTVDGAPYYRGLGFLSEINDIFIQEITRTLGRL
ncbi:MAG: sirohydrochlorin cobaltochelatase [Deferrisomatales bacterium]|nr:sirohydrochlorin cobaltochelatase [Deferrisomatales bacterium]